MPEVRVQDEQGTVHVFPDGSTPEMIAKAMNVKPPAAQAAPADQPKEGLFHSLGSDLLGMVKSSPHMLPPVMAYDKAKEFIANYESMRDTGKTLAERDAATRAQAGHGFAYQVGAGVNEQLGVNVKGMEQAANRGDMGGVIGHAAAVPAAAVITEGLARGVPAVVNPITKFAGEKVAPGMVNYAIGTPAKAMRYGKNPGAEVVNAGIADTGMEGLHEKIGAELQSKSSELNQVLSTPAAKAVRIDVRPAVKVVEDAIGQAMRRNQPELVTQLRSLRDQLTTRLAPTGKQFPVAPVRTAQEVMDLKRGVQESVNWNTGAAYEKPLNGVKKQVQGALDNLVTSKLPEVGPLNDSISNLIDAKAAAGERANAIATGKYLVRTPEIAAGVGAGMAAGGPAGVAAALAMRGVRTTGGLTYGAQALRAASMAKFPKQWAAYRAGAAVATQRKDDDEK